MQAMNALGSFLNHGIADHINLSILFTLSNNGLRDLKVDEHMDNVYHGHFHQCPDFPTHKTNVSLLVLRNCRDPHEVKRHIINLGRINEFKTILKVVCLIDLTHQESPVSFPCLITERTPSLTFQELFSAISSFHQRNTFFGNLEGSLRVSRNKPILEFLAWSNGAGTYFYLLVYFRKLQLLIIMKKIFFNSWSRCWNSEWLAVFEKYGPRSFPTKWKRDLFERLCSLYFSDSTVVLAHGNQLRFLSFLALNFFCLIFWFCKVTRESLKRMTILTVLPLYNINTFHILGHLYPYEMAYRTWLIRRWCDASLTRRRNIEHFSIQCRVRIRVKEITDYTWSEGWGFIYHEPSWLKIPFNLFKLYESSI